MNHRLDWSHWAVWPPGRRVGRVASIAVASALLVTACGDDDGPDEAEANAAVCDSLGSLVTATGELASLDPTVATRDDYADAVEAVQSAREGLVEGASDVAEADWEGLEDDVDELVEQLQDAPDDEAVADILTAATPQLVQVRADVATFGMVVCGIEPVTTTPGT